MLPEKVRPGSGGQTKKYAGIVLQIYGIKHCAAASPMAHKKSESFRLCTLFIMRGETKVKET